MINFKYTPKTSIAPLIVNSIVNGNGESLDGILSEGNVNMIRMCGLFLICEPREDSNTGKMKYYNPLAVVAQDEVKAVEIYSRHMSEVCNQNVFGSCMFCLEHNAAKATIITA